MNEALRQSDTPMPVIICTSKIERDAVVARCSQYNDDDDDDDVVYALRDCGVGKLSTLTSSGKSCRPGNNISALSQEPHLYVSRYSRYSRYSRTICTYHAGSSRFPMLPVGFPCLLSS